MGIYWFAEQLSNNQRNRLHVMLHNVALYDAKFFIVPALNLDETHAEHEFGYYLSFKTNVEQLSSENSADNVIHGLAVDVLPWEDFLIKAWNDNGNWGCQISFRSELPQGTVLGMIYNRNGYSNVGSVFYADGLHSYRRT